MNNIYILAQAGDEGPSSIETTPINEQSESITVVADSNPACFLEALRKNRSNISRWLTI
ncbi:MAG: hypothetical protein ACYSW6_05085 [Planctomycetota bacterium]|jgi:hypothetical protein